MAGNNIKGISIVIDGETGPLQTALKGVNKTSYDLQSELKQVNNQLKFDPNNTVLLAQKQELLSKSITNTSEKLATLKQAEAQAQVQFERGEISAEQYRALQREVIKTESQLGNLESQAKKSSGALEGAAKAGAKVGDKLIVAGVAAVGTTMLGTAVAGVTMGDDLTKALNGIESATGYSKESMAGMKDTMLSIYNNNFGADFEDIGVALQEVGKQTGLTGKELENMTTNALMLKDTFEYEVADSTKAATMMMTQFGTTGEESFNLIAQGAQYGLDKNGDLLDSINEYSTNFAMAGLSSQDMFNMFQNGAAGGVISSDKIGDAIKEFGIRSKDMSKGTSEAFKSLGLNVDKTSMAFAKGGAGGKKAFEEVNKKLFEMKDPLAQNATGTALYGSMWEDVGAKGIKALTDMDGEISTSTNALKGINDVKYNSFGEGMEGIKRQLITGLALPIGQDLLPKMNEFSGNLKEKMPGAIATLKPIIESLIDKVVFLASHLNIIIPIITGVVAALITMSIINKIVQFYGALTKVMSLVSLAKLKDIGQTITLNALYVKDALVKGASAIAQGALTVATAAWNIVCGIATGITAGLGIAFAFLTSPIGLVILAIAAVIAIGVLLYKNWDLIMAKAGPIFEGIKTIIVTVFNSIKSFIGTVLNGIMVIITTIFNIIKLLITVYVTSWMIIIQTIFNVIKTVITVAVNAIRTVITTVFNAIKTVITTIFNTINAVSNSIWNGIRAVISGAVNGIKSVVSSSFNNIKSTVTGVWNSIRSTTASVWNGIKNAIMTPVNAAKDGVKKAVDSIKGFFSNLKLPEIKIPKMKMPHFGMTGEFSLSPPKVPKMSVDWYDKGGIFNTPNIIGVGEKRPEFVGALDDLREIVRSEIKGAGNNGGAQTINVPVYLDGKTIATVTTPYADKIGGSNINLMNRGLIV